MEENAIHVVILPPNTTDSLQPMDRKGYYEAAEWEGKLNSGLGADHASLVYPC